ncbi:ferric reduction oxidase 7, chloroplastic-like [Jatropha curcas]|uniref:ferric reduction oxidase 7, chloroplastic-like n=1 Tax=Jatropha curcas TaxID=180498 RepID=UPI0018952807|nr:ferric reduction oxidase 7, chloroplastic-like [Jatropha curcas]
MVIFGKWINTHQLLLSNGNLQMTDYVSKKAAVFSLILKWILKIAMLAAFIAWLTVVFMYPIESLQTWFKNWTQASADSFLGFTGGVFLIFNGPLIIIALLSIPYLTLCSREEELQKKGGAKRRGHGLGTFPIVVDGPFGVVSAAEFIPFGVVSAAEFIGILVFLGYIAWVACIYAVQKISVIFTNPEYTIGDKWSWTFRMSARGFGLAGIFCLSSFLFIPVARSSLLLCLVNIPTEHAIRYHIWLGHLCMLLFTFHGLFYVIGWFVSGKIPSALIAWDATDGAKH